ncbi:MAG: gamma-glutamyltransferase family protein [Spirochaetales bacterium]
MKLNKPAFLFAGIVLVVLAGIVFFVSVGTESSGGSIVSRPQVDARSHREAVVSAHELATEAGAEVLDAGGTAADAAMAVGSALSVVQPWFSSVFGGGTWALYYDADSGEVTSMDGVGPAGSKASAEDFEERARDSGMHQAIVPGAWDGWMLWLEEYGRLELEEILSPAIELAEDGYPASPGLIQWLGIDGDNFDKEAFAYSRELYEDVEEEGDTVYQPGQAQTFRDVLGAWEDARSDGRSEAIQAARDYVYRGPVAEAIVDFSDEHGGYLTLEDFQDFEAELVEPISIDYNGIEVFQNPPNSQGITQLMLLNILKDYDFEEMELDGPDAVHLQVEATKLAFADRYYHVGDPDFVDVPVETLLSEEHAAERREAISMDSVLEWPIEDLLGSGDTDRTAGHTTTFHITDEEGNAAAVTTSLGAQYLVVGETGIHINNRMRMMAVDEGDPNRLEPGKKVRHTSNPYMAMIDGAPYILGGNTGVDTQPQGQAQQFLAVVEFDADPQTAVSRKRFVSRGFPATSFPYSVEGDVQFEDDFDDSVMEELEDRGHSVSEGGTFGSANMLVIDPETGEIEAGADPRDGVSGSIIR